MRALYSILIALAVTGGTPAFGAPFWQKHNPPPASARPAPPASAPVQNNLMGQAPAATAGAGPQSSGAGPQLHLIGPGPHKGDWLRKYLGLSPSQQEKSLEQDPSFRALPADKQKHLLDRLRTFGCDRAQGWHLSPALPADQVIGWFDEHLASLPLQRVSGR